MSNHICIKDTLTHSDKYMHKQACFFYWRSKGGSVFHGLVFKWEWHTWQWIGMDSTSLSVYHLSVCRSTYCSVYVSIHPSIPQLTETTFISRVVLMATDKRWNDSFAWTIWWLYILYKQPTGQSFCRFLYRYLKLKHNTFTTKSRRQV